MLCLELPVGDSAIVVLRLPSDVYYIPVVVLPQLPPFVPHLLPTAAHAPQTHPQLIAVSSDPVIIAHQLRSLRTAIIIDVEFGDPEVPVIAQPFPEVRDVLGEAEHCVD